MNKKKLTIRIGEDLHQALIKMKAKTGLPLNSLVNGALIMYVEELFERAAKVGKYAKDD